GMIENTQRRPGLVRRAILASTRLLFLEEEVLLGGQAVLEGVMMRSPRSMAVAVRKANGEIAVLRRAIPSLGERYPVLKWPVLRGAVVMIQALVLGISSLNFSAEAAFEDLEKEKPAEAEAKPKGTGLMIAGSVIVSLAVGLALFFLMPLALTDLV